mmetsp:Transcript_79203/g.214475  ORF Transcript_79203/g.214475 Transcript_79203/m.214475 type:complete len:229 (-) Transcript_79203:56-742(-)
MASRRASPWPAPPASPASEACSEPPGCSPSRALAPLGPPAAALRRRRCRRCPRCASPCRPGPRRSCWLPLASCPPCFSLGCRWRCAPAPWPSSARGSSSSPRSCCGSCACDWSFSFSCRRPCRAACRCASGFACRPCSRCGRASRGPCLSPFSSPSPSPSGDGPSWGCCWSWSPYLASPWSPRRPAAPHRRAFRARPPREPPTAPRSRAPAHRPAGGGGSLWSKPSLL